MSFIATSSSFAARSVARVREVAHRTASHFVAAIRGIVAPAIRRADAWGGIGVASPAANSGARFRR